MTEVFSKSSSERSRLQTAARPHAGLDETVDDGAVPPGAGAFAEGTLVRKFEVFRAAAVSGAAADDGEMIGSVEKLPPLALGERPFDLQAGAGQDGL